MQKIIAKYGAAANLAVLTVAPLFMYPFFSDAQIATALLWFSFAAFFWMILEPSIRRNEALHTARKRVLRGMMKDPLFWILLVLILVTGVQALNGGVAVVYEAEEASWKLSLPAIEIFPGCVDGKGYLPFATIIAGSVLVQACRHSLGPAARMAFLFLSSLLAGLSAVIAVVCGTSGNEVVQTALSCSALASYYVGAAYYMHLFAGTVALVAAFERRWNMTVPLYAFSIGATASAGFLFSPFLQTTIFLSAEILILVYVFVYSLKVLPPTAEFKFLAVFSMAFSLGGLMAMAFEPTRAMEHVDALLNLDFIPESFAVVRDALSGVAIRSWFKNLWIGIGLGSFPIAFRFTATPEDLVVVRAGAEAVPNGWLMILSEGGVVAALMVVLPYGFLFYTWVRRLVGWVMTRTFCHPACCCGLLILPVVAVSGLYGCSFLRADVMIVTWALFSVSASAFPRKMRKDHGR